MPEGVGRPFNKKLKQRLDRSAAAIARSPGGLNKAIQGEVRDHALREADLALRKRTNAAAVAQAEQRKTGSVQTDLRKDRGKTAVSQPSAASLARMRAATDEAASAGKARGKLRTLRKRRTLQKLDD